MQNGFTANCIWFRNVEVGLFCFDNSGHVKWGVDHYLYVVAMSLSHTRQFLYGQVKYYNFNFSYIPCDKMFMYAEWFHRLRERFLAFWCNCGCCFTSFILRFVNRVKIDSMKETASIN
jgi:hypothetical protein